MIKFDGFLSVYQETLEEGEKKADGEEDDDSSQRLPAMAVGETITSRAVDANQHFTQPPPRFSEATLVKRLEELGIGRPSTYASIISVLVDRGYVTLDQRRFTAATLGRIVTAFLMSYFDRYVEYDFTADMEENLDKVADGERDWKAELRAFWKDFSAKVEDSKKLTISEVLLRIEQLLEAYIFGTGDDAAKAKICPSCSKGDLHLKTGKFGSFLGCSNYPECNYTRQLTGSASENEAGAADANNGEEYPKILGVDPISSEQVSLRKGPYGMYVQLGIEKKPKRTGLPKGLAPADVDLAKALALLSLPREVGIHPETNEPIVANIGRFGPYLLHAGKYANLSPEDDVLSVGMNRAVTLIAEAAVKKGKFGARTGPEPLKDLGEHQGEKVVILKGRYGPYIKFGGSNITLPKGKPPEEFTLEDAIPLLGDAKPASKGKKSAPAKKTAAKAPAKKTAAKKKAAGK